MEEEGTYLLTIHASRVIRERQIADEWVRPVLLNPEKIEQDARSNRVRHALARLPERGGRVLRIIYDDTESPKRVITAYFDRSRRGQL